MSLIATRWHLLHEAVRSGRIKSLNLDLSNSTLVDVRLGDHYDIMKFHQLIESMARYPRFVLEKSVVDLISTDQAVTSLNDMFVCGMLNLPYPACTVEYSVDETHYSILLRESNLGIVPRWYISTMACRKDNLGEFHAIAYPCQIELIINVGGEQDDSATSIPAQPTIRYNILKESYINDGAEAKRIINDIYPLVFRRSFVAFLAAVLLPQTIGVDRKDAVVKPSFNRLRLSKGRCAVPNHTIIRLGEYRTATGSIKSIGERSNVEVHLRRAHKRRVAFGEGRREREWRFFPAQVVGYLPDGRKPSMPEILATRATKPYLLK